MTSRVGCPSAIARSTAIPSKRGADRCHVAVIGAAATAHHRELLKQSVQLPMLHTQLIRVPRIELAGLVELGVAAP